MLLRPELTDAGEIPGDGQRHSDDAALGGGVGGLSSLPVESGDGGRVDDDAPLRVLVGFFVEHQRRALANHVERSHQIHVDYFLWERKRGCGRMGEDIKSAKSTP